MDLQGVGMGKKGLCVTTVVRPWRRETRKENCSMMDGHEVAPGYSGPLVFSSRKIQNI